MVPHSYRVKAFLEQMLTKVNAHYVALGTYEYDE